MLLRPALLLVVLAGCPEPTLPECTQPGDVVMVAEDEQSVVSDVSDGSTVPLIPAPQGGHILLIGARIRANATCQLDATASLRDPVTQRVIGLDERPLLLEKRSDGWAVPKSGLASLPNVAVCPQSATTTPIYDHAFKLELMLGGTIMVSAMVTPTCSSSYCMQECS